jgi:hypothetical protein
MSSFYCKTGVKLVILQISWSEKSAELPDFMYIYGNFMVQDNIWLNPGNKKFIDLSAKIGNMTG